MRSQVVGFKKIKFFTNENVGAGKLELPENEMHTTAFWITLERTNCWRDCRSRFPIDRAESLDCSMRSNRWRRCC